MLFIGMLQSVIYGLVFWGEQFIDSGVSAVLFSTMPFFVVLFSFILIGKDAVYLTHIAGIALSLFGTYFIYDPDFSVNPEFIWGFGAILLSAVVSSYMAVYVKVHAGQIPAITNTAVQMLVAGIVLSAISVLFEPIADIRWSATGFAAVMYLGIVGSAIAFALYMWVIKRVSPLTASIIPLLTPIVAIIIGWLILHERMTIQILTGCGLILTGIYFINVKKGLIRLPGSKTGNKE
jgi:drug/metabolite transporter (DMT)-like permease